MEQPQAHQWRQRSPEWIAENPGKGTMYKHYPAGGEPPKAEKVNKQIFLPDKKDKTAIEGTYVVFCEAENHAYVGQSRNIPIRLRNHKMYIQGELNANKAYKRMREHCGKHGIEAFTFCVHTVMQNATIEEMLAKEKETMLDILNKGYTLYNGSFTLDILKFVYCPDIKVQSLVKRVIEGINEKKITIDQVIKTLNL